MKVADDRHHHTEIGKTCGKFGERLSRRVGVYRDANELAPRRGKAGNLRRC